MQPFSIRLEAAVREKRTPALVGIDPRIEGLPAGLREACSSKEGGCKAKAEAVGQFCRELLDVVAPLVPAVKPQAAFFEQFGPAGAIVLGEVIEYAHAKGLLVVLDAKRNDIGSTATAYAEGLLGSGGQSPWGADALTVSPYLGGDSLEPFVRVALQRRAGLFVLVKTSNPGGGMFQDLIADGKPVHVHVAEHVEELARQTIDEPGRTPLRNEGRGRSSSTGCSPCPSPESRYGAVGAVVGATYPEQLLELRQRMPHAWLLVPGFGSQGGTAADVAGAFDVEGTGAIVNSSRAINFAHQRPEYAERFGDARWQEAVEAATRDMIEQLASETPAGRLR